MYWTYTGSKVYGLRYMEYLLGALKNIPPPLRAYCLYENHKKKIFPIRIL